MVVFGFILTIFGVFFDVFILWRSSNWVHHPEVIDAIAHFFVELGNFLQISYIVDPAARLFIAFIRIIAAIDLSSLLSTVNVSCQGSVAPLELLANYLILGAVVIIIESEFSFLSITRQRMFNNFWWASRSEVGIHFYLYNQHAYKLYFFSSDLVVL